MALAGYGALTGMRELFNSPESPLAVQRLAPFAPSCPRVCLSPDAAQDNLELRGAPALPGGDHDAAGHRRDQVDLSLSWWIAPPSSGTPQQPTAVDERREVAAEQPGAAEGPLQFADHCRPKPRPGAGRAAGACGGVKAPIVGHLLVHPVPKLEHKLHTSPLHIWPRWSRLTVLQLFEHEATVNDL